MSDDASAAPAPPEAEAGTDVLAAMARASAGEGASDEGWLAGEASTATLASSESTIAAVAQAAKLSETGARGFVGLESMSGVVTAVKDLFAAAEREGKGRVVPADLIRRMREAEPVQLMLDEPARMHESDGTTQPLSVVIDEIEARTAELPEIDLAEIYACFGMGGPDIREAVPETFTAKDAKTLRINLDELAEDRVGAARLVYVGGLGRSDRTQLRLDAFQSTRPKFEEAVGTSIVRSDMQILDVNTLRASQPWTNNAW